MANPHRFRYIALILLLILLGCTTLPACSKKESPAKKPESSSAQKPKSPPEAKKITEELDKIIVELDKTINMKQQSPIQQNAQLEPQGQAGGQGQEQGQAQGQSKGNSQQKSAGQSQEQPQQKTSGGQSGGGGSAQQTGGDWQKVEQSLKNIHQSWNKLEPEAVKAGLSTTARDNFETALDDLTKRVGEQNPEESLLAAAALYNHYSELARVFTMSVPPDFFQVKYEILSAIIEARRQQWDVAREHVPTLQQHWNNLKLQAKQADMTMLNQTEFSIHDLEQAIEGEHPDLVSIKGEIAMNNLKQLEKKLTSKSSGQV